MRDTVPTKDAVIPAAALQNVRALLQLGVMYAAEKMLCSDPDCADCRARAQLTYEALCTIGQDGEVPWRWEWSKGHLRLVVTDPSEVGLTLPPVGQSVMALEKAGFDVVHELTAEPENDD